MTLAFSHPVYQVLMAASGSTINRRNSYLLGIEFSDLNFLPVLAAFSIKLCKIVDSISSFPYNSTKYELRIRSEFWQILGA
jgi:hypothetical protein